LIFQLSEQEESNRLEIYNEIEKLVEKTKTKFEKKYLFQLDLVKDCKKMYHFRESPSKHIKCYAIAYETKY
jgi:hypothetical protein